MTPKFLLLFVICALAVKISAQKNVSKLSISDAALKMYNVSQERALFKRSSIQLNLKIKPLTTISGAKYSRIWYPNPDRNPILNTKMSALVASAEYRLYKKTKPMNSLYMGFWASMADYKVSTGQFNTNYIFPQTGTEYQISLQQDYHAFVAAAGIELGLQKKIGKNLIIDWNILGLGLSNVNLSGKVKMETTAGDFDLRTLDKNTFDTHCKLEEYVTVNKTINEHDVLLKAHALMPMLHMGVSIGFGY